jgi:hypothetical protein|tara:strand:- start:51 stop:296 length:246 start_codon:yes stop_codon:yes gene_type:complete
LIGTSVSLSSDGETIAVGPAPTSGAIADLTEAISYNRRALAKAIAGLSHCSNYKKTCDLGYDKSCEYYDGQFKWLIIRKEL